MFDTDDLFEDANLLKPYEIFRHPEARIVSTFLLRNNNYYSIIYGDSGIGKSLFVKAHCDIYWNKYNSKYVFIDDPDFVSSDFFDKYEIIPKFLYIDSLYIWSLNIFKAFLRKIENNFKGTKIIFVFPELISNEYIQYSYKIQTNPNHTFVFFNENKYYFKFFQNNYLQFFKNYIKCNGNLSKIMQIYLYNIENCDVVNDIKFNFKSLNDCDTYFYNYFNFDDTYEDKLDFSQFLHCGNFHTQLEILDTISNFDQNLNDIYGFDIITNKLYLEYFSLLWFHSFKNNFMN